MHRFFSRTSGAALFLLTLTLPASGPFERSKVPSLEDLWFSLGLSPTQETAQGGIALARLKLGDTIRPFSAKRLEAILSQRLRPFPKKQIAKFSQHLLKLCRHHRFDPTFVLSVIDVESRFHIHARSEVGALGLMQLMPPTAQFIVNELEPYLTGLEKWDRDQVEDAINAENESVLKDPFTNTALGVAYLAWLRDHYEGSPFHLLGAYYVGPARMDQLLARKHFTPVKTKLYFEEVQKRLPRFRTALRRKHSPIECLVDLSKKECYLEI